MKRKVLAIVLCAAILCGIGLPLGYQAMAAENTPTPNMDALNAILYGDRRWVYETLIEDSRANNPMTILSGNPARKSMARQALNDYRNIDANGQSNASAYRMLVGIMEKVYNADEYAAGLEKWIKMIEEK